MDLLFKLSEQNISLIFFFSFHFFFFFFFFFPPPPPPPPPRREVDAAVAARRTFASKTRPSPPPSPAYGDSHPRPTCKGVHSHTQHTFSLNLRLDRGKYVVLFYWFVNGLKTDELRRRVIVVVVVRIRRPPPTRRVSQSQVTLHYRHSHEVSRPTDQISRVHRHVRVYSIA